MSGVPIREPGEIRCAECGVLLSTTALGYGDDRPVYCYRHWKAHQRLLPMVLPSTSTSTPASTRENLQHEH